MPKVCYGVLELGAVYLILQYFQKLHLLIHQLPELNVRLTKVP